MKHLKSVKTIQKLFLNLMNRLPVMALVIGFGLIYGAAGSMDYTTATGTADNPVTVYLLIVGLILMGAGVYGKRKNFRN